MGCIKMNVTRLTVFFRSIGICVGLTLLCAAAPVRLAPLGDSRTAIIAYDTAGLNRSTQSHLNWANALNEQKFRYTGNFAIAGATSDQIIEKMLAPALVSRPTHLIILMGVNDVRGPGFNAERTCKNIVRAAEAAIAQGATPILCTDPGGEHYLPAHVEFINDVNARLKAFCADQPRAVLFDMAALVSEQRSPKIVFHPGWFYDGVHLQTLGAYKVGEALGRLLNEHGAEAPVSPAATANLLQNAALAGEDGKLGVGTTGKLPEGFTSSRDKPEVTGEFSVAERADGTRELRVHVANANAKTLAGVRVTRAIALDGLAPGDALEGGVRVEIDPGSVNLGDVRAAVEMVFTDGTFAISYDFQNTMAREGKPPRDTLSSLGLNSPLSLTLRTPPLACPADKTIKSVVFRLGARLAGEGKATVRFHQPWCAKVGS